MSVVDGKHKAALQHRGCLSCPGLQLKADLGYLTFGKIERSRSPIWCGYRPRKGRPRTQQTSLLAGSNRFPEASRCERLLYVRGRRPIARWRGCIPLCSKRLHPPLKTTQHHQFYPRPIYCNALWNEGSRCWEKSRMSAAKRPVPAPCSTTVNGEGSPRRRHISSS